MNKLWILGILLTILISCAGVGSASECYWDIGLTNGLVHSYNMSDNLDYAGGLNGNAINLDPLGSPHIESSGALIPPYLNGTDVDGFETTGLADSSLQLIGNTTMNLWVKVDDCTMAHEVIIEKRNSLGGRYLLSTSETKSFEWQEERGVNTFDIFTPDNSCQDEVWTMFTIVENDTDITIYLDGTFNQNQSTGGSIRSSNTDYVYMKTSYLSPKGITGGLDEVYFWNRTLTATEINTLYNEGAGMTFDPNAGIDTCTPPVSGNWNVNLADNCVVTSNVDLGGNSLIITGGPGNFTIYKPARITNYNLFKFIADSINDIYNVFANGQYLRITRFT
jgi:hypothetical protein